MDTECMWRFHFWIETYHSDIHYTYFGQHCFEIAQLDILCNTMMPHVKIFQVGMSGTQLIQLWRNTHYWRRGGSEKMVTIAV